MSVLHQLIPFGDEMRSAQFAAYFGRAIPDDARHGRNPQAAELMAAFAQAKIDGHEAELEGAAAKSWAVVIRDGGGEKLRIDAKLRGKDRDNLLYTITGDRDLLEYVVAHLPAACGSYLISTNGENPVVVTAGG